MKTPLSRCARCAYPLAQGTRCSECGHDGPTLRIDRPELARRLHVDAIIVRLMLVVGVVIAALATHDVGAAGTKVSMPMWAGASLLPAFFAAIAALCGSWHSHVSKWKLTLFYLVTAMTAAAGIAPAIADAPNQLMLVVYFGAIGHFILGLLVHSNSMKFLPTHRTIKFAVHAESLLVAFSAITVVGFLFLFPVVVVLATYVDVRMAIAFRKWHSV